MRDESWIDRCVGARDRVSLEPEQLTAAVAAATVALDGRVSPPEIEPQMFFPQRHFEVAWTVALGALVTGRDAGELVERALAATSVIKKPGDRDRALLWGALELRAHGYSDGATHWTAGIQDADAKHELAAGDVARLAERGDIERARRALAELPAMWSIRSDVTAWHGYPRWLGSAAAAAAVVAAPETRGLVEDAERLSESIDQDWRRNREQRALALAWARLGDLERAFVAASRMPGSERADALVELLDRFGDAPGLEVATLARLARRAMASTRSAPFILTDSVGDRAELADFVGQATEAQVEAAIARRHLARGDLAAARKLAERLPANLSAREESALQVQCARLRLGEIGIDELMATVPTSDWIVPNLVDAAASSGCVPVVQALLPRAQYPDRIARNVIQRLTANGWLEAALAMLRGVGEHIGPFDRAETQAQLAMALATAGRFDDAIALVRAAHDMPRADEVLLVAGHRVIVVLAAAGETAKASALRADLAPRLRR
jgi:tetratricopeptide (TPR) repeat protein